MLRSVKNFIWLLATVVGVQSAFGWALIGPSDVVGTPDAFQVPDIGFAIPPSDRGTPKSLHDEYRRVTPVIYYAADQSFYTYFRGTNGDEGVRELDKAFAMYNAVGKVSQLDINDFPEESRRVNFQAGTIGLWDLKSYVMGLLSEDVGLFQPTRWVWMLSYRAQLPHPGLPGCPFNMEYAVQSRNFSIFPSGTDEYPTSSYVNGVLYTYYIYEGCTVPLPPTADAVEMPVDPVAVPYSAVADYESFWYAGLVPGMFYTSLTRDDVAGMKYLYATNNFNNEAAGQRTTEFVTNNVPQFIVTQDLGALAAAAPVNNAAALSALFPGLIITSSSNYIGFAITTNITQTLINLPLDPAGSVPSHPVFSTNYTTNVVNFFVHSFGNIVTNTYATRGLIGVLGVGITNSPFAPAGTPPTTNTTAKIIPVPGVFGDFFILPTNLCGAQIISNMLTTVTATTNLPVTLPGISSNSVTFVPGSVTFQTNHTVLFLPVTCPVDAVGVRGGVDQLQFVRRDYDAITAQFWEPVTNDYALIEIDETNHTSSLRHFSRAVVRPDIMFSAADLSTVNFTISYTNIVDGAVGVFTFTPGPNSAPGASGVVIADFLFDETGRNGHENGPGTIFSPDPLPEIYIFNRQAPIFDNLSPANGTTNSFLYITQETQAPFFAFGSFDGTTNTPVVYPNGTSFLSLQNLLLGPAPATPWLPNGNVGVLYTAQLAAKGGTAPYTFSLAPTSPGLPAGLNISADGKITGTPTGPAAIYDFTVRITDNAGVFRDVQYTITLF